ncbi:MAG: histidine--tRNA ligase, partial [Chloroflexi bacterium]|nr:histidine--tRNA ligase [Chloroflexota bacterium]
PQAGRYRQHHQFGAEAIGDADPAVDAEVVRMAWQLLADLGLKGLALSINSIGDRACRPQYLETLRAYYRERLSQLCADCQGRFERNTLRLLDCKKEGCQAHAESAPRSYEHLCGPCTEHFGKLRSYLEALGLPYVVSHRLVRGLDYYTRTVFEVQPPEEGAQSTIAGGGRYDGLIEELGGRPTPAVGFATGIERIALNLKRQGVSVPDLPPVRAYVCYLGDAAKVEALKLADALRQSGVSAVLAPGGKSLKGQLRQAASAGAAYAVILGEDELRSGAAVVKRLDTGEQRSVPRGEVAEVVQK